MKNWLSLFLVLFLTPQAFAERVRKVKVKKDQIVQVKAALGVATIIQVPDNPTSLVVGDNEAFKVEFLENAITIKPLHANAKSNLYIYTEYRRFDVQLVTASEPAADYVVYLADFVADPISKPSVSWKSSTLSMKNDALLIQIHRIGHSTTSLFIEFEVQSQAEIQFDPAWIWFTESKMVIPIHRLVMSSFRLDKGSPIHGVAEILKADVKPSKFLSFELRRKAQSKIDIPKATL